VIAVRVAGRTSREISLEAPKTAVYTRRTGDGGGGGEGTTWRSQITMCIC